MRLQRIMFRLSFDKGDTKFKIIYMHPELYAYHPKINDISIL